MRWAFGDPALEEGPDVGAEEAARVGVARRGDRTVDAFALGDDELELSLRSHTDAKHRDRAFLDLEFDARAFAGFAVVFDEAAEHRLGGGDVDVMRAIVADEYEAFPKIDGVKLGETSPDIEAIHDEHGDACFQIGLAAHRETGSGE